MVRKSNANKENNHLLLINDLIKCQIIIKKMSVYFKEETNLKKIQIHC